MRVRREVLEQNKLVCNFTMVMLIKESKFVKAHGNDVDLKVQGDAGETK
jgi:hypothetical protein